MHMHALMYMHAYVSVLVCERISFALFIPTHQIKEEVLSSMKANFGKRLKIVNVGKYDVCACICIW